MYHFHTIVKSKHSKSNYHKSGTVYTSSSRNILPHILHMANSFSTQVSVQISKRYIWTLYLIFFSMPSTSILLNLWIYFLLDRVTSILQVPVYKPSSQYTFSDAVFSLPDGSDHSLNSHSLLSVLFFSFFSLSLFAILDCVSFMGEVAWNVWGSLTVTSHVRMRHKGFLVFCNGEIVYSNQPFHENNYSCWRKV